MNDKQDVASEPNDEPDFNDADRDAQNIEYNLALAYLYLRDKLSERDEYILEKSKKIEYYEAGINKLRAENAALKAENEWLQKQLESCQRTMRSIQR